MNKENAHLFLPLVKALSEGKKLEYRYSDGWKSSTDVSFNMSPEYYRIAEPPKELYSIFSKSGTYMSSFPDEAGAYAQVAAWSLSIAYSEQFPFTVYKTVESK